MAIRKDPDSETWSCKVLINKRGELRVYIPRDLARVLVEQEEWKDKAVLRAHVFKPSPFKPGHLWLTFEKR